MKIVPVWRHPRTLLEQSAGLGAAGALAYYWLGIAESGLWQTLLSAAAALAIVTAVTWLTLRARRQLRADPSAGSIVMAHVIFAACAIAGYCLVWWIPAVEGFALQAASMAARFGLALFLILLGWLNLVASTDGLRGAS